MESGQLVEAERLKFEEVGTARQLRAERWHSTEKRDEIHFFVKGTDLYVAGFNPKLITAAQMEAVLKAAGFEL